MYVGIDISMNSSGICVIDNNNIDLYFITKRKSLIDFKTKNGNFYIEGKNYNYSKNNIIRFESISSHIIDILTNYEKIDKIGIEGYSYNSLSNSIFQIGELGGIIKNKIYNTFNDIDKIEIIPPKNIKKYFTGRGDASKNGMYERFDLLHRNDINLYDILNIKKSKTGNIPHPIEDLVDAYAICLYIQNVTLDDVKITDNIINDLERML